MRPGTERLWVAAVLPGLLAFIAFMLWPLRHAGWWPLTHEMDRYHVLAPDGRMRLILPGAGATELEAWYNGPPFWRMRMLLSALVLAGWLTLRGLWLRRHPPGRSPAPPTPASTPPEPAAPASPAG